MIRVDRRRADDAKGYVRLVTRGVSADEFMAQLQADPEWVAANSEREREHDRRAAELALAEQPILRDLHGVGVDVGSVWELIDPDIREPVFSILLEHLRRGGYPDRVTEGVARALGSSLSHWEMLVDLLVHTQSDAAAEGLAASLSTIGRRKQIDSLRMLLGRAELGRNRIFFVRPVLRYGGPAGVAEIEALHDDPVVGVEATHALHQRRLRQAARQRRAAAQA